MKLTRQLQRRQNREQPIAEEIINEFVNRYYQALNDYSETEKKSLELGKKPRQILKNRKHALSDINAVYIEVWRVVVDTIRVNQPLANIKPDYFNSKIVWQSKSAPGNSLKPSTMKLIKTPA